MIWQLPACLAPLLAIALIVGAATDGDVKRWPAGKRLWYMVFLTAVSGIVVFCLCNVVWQIKLGVEYFLTGGCR